MKAKSILLTIVAFVCLTQACLAVPMGTAFTYQGRLTDTGSPAEGIYEMEFTLHDSAADPNELGTFSPGIVDVAGGYFTVAVDFGSSVFNGDARWLEIGVRPQGSADPFTVLAPRQEVTPTPYALQTRGIFVNNLLNVGIGTLSPAGKLHVDGGEAMDGTPGGGLFFKAQDGGDGWVMQNDGADGGDILLLPGEGGEEFDRGIPGADGNVGIRTMDPLSKLSVGGDGLINTGIYGNGINQGVYGDGSAYGVFGSGSYSGVHGEDKESGSFGRLGHDTCGVYASGTVYGGYFLGDGYFSGDVGIGTMSPDAQLHISGASSQRIHLESTFAAGTAFIKTSNGDRTWQFGTASSEPFIIQDLTAGPIRMKIDTTGNVGIGAGSPVTKLHIEGGTDASLTGGGFLVTGSVGSINVVIDNNEIMARNNGAAAPLYLNKGSGNVIVGVLEITGGSDLAEPFKVTGEESIEPGMVVAIDPEHTGQLRIADRAYDRTVAGIVSGANGINPGMTMRQEDTLANGSILVALTGRVYVWADASNGLIEPGDLLTTSKTPGHAMKVTDYSKAHGAILGKAMSSLQQGKGLVLVLVTLQ